MYHGVVPAVLGSDLKLLKRSLRELRSMGFKAREVANQTQNVKDFMDYVDENTSLAVGMSSLGPLVYVVSTAKDHRVQELVGRASIKYGGSLLGVFRGRNKGYEVRA
jgi:beta-RFAP synthase